MTGKLNFFNNRFFNDRFFNAFVELTYDCEYFRTVDGHFIYVTPSCHRITGYIPEDFYNDSDLMEKIIHPDFLELWKDYHQQMPEGEKQEIDFKIITKSGEERWISHICQKVEFVVSGLRGFRASNSDITDRKQLEQDLKHAALHDHLTGLMNRRFMMEQLKNLIYQYQRTQKVFSIVICDIDDFKSVNDNYGHECGDVILVEIANLLKNQLRKQDFICRWGGEEFMIILPQTPLKGAREVAEKLRASIEAKRITYHGHEIKVTMSFGVHQYDCADMPDPCIRKADMNLYKAKLAGKNRVF
jgi:diguanylate cyclase (GGDEF)-like protein/PAS domain S-box-containing protein